MDGHGADVASIFPLVIDEISCLKDIWVVYYVNLDLTDLINASFWRTPIFFVNIVSWN